MIAVMIAAKIAAMIAAALENNPECIQNGIIDFIQFVIFI